MSDHLRLQVAACTRILVMLRIVGYSGHVSARLADDDGFVIQRFADPRIGLQPDRLLALRVSDDRRPTEGDAPDEVHIHREIYRSRPDVRAVAHFHHDPTTMFTMADGVELVPMRNCSVRWRDGIPTHPDAARIATPGQGRALVATLAGAFAVQLRAHGQVVVAEDVPSLLTDAVHFVENADALATALRLGPVKPLTTAEGEAFLSTFSRIRHADKIWRYHVAAAVRDGAIPASWTDELLKETRPA